MQPLHDKDLDRLSREAAEHFGVETGASGWDNLEKRLNVELPQKKKKRRFLFWLFFITATTGGALIGILKYKPVTPLGGNVPGIVTPAGKTAQTQPNTTASTPTGSDNIAGSKTNNSTTGNNTQPVRPSQIATGQQPVNGVTTPATDQPNTTTAPVTAGNQPATVATQNTTTPEKKTVKPTADPNRTIRSKPGTKAQGVDKTPLTLNYATITPASQGNGTVRPIRKPKGKPGKQQNITAGQQKATVKPDGDNTQEPATNIADTDQPTNADQPKPVTDAATAQQPATPAVDPAKKDAVTAAATDSAKTPEQPLVKKEDVKQDKKARGLELGFMVGPDLTSAKFGPVYKPGYNFGLQVGYRFSNRWSVNTGVIYTKKFYKADSQDFHYKMQWNYKLENVEGNCSMWEIPVNIRYDFSYNDKRRWFASTGLSTYFMDKEYYDIYYSYNGNPNYPSYPIDSDSNSSYYFSIWNLSVGMERSLGKHFSIQAEPYLKIPMKGLGTGDMRMTSYGILFTLKYKPVFNSKRSDTRK